MRVGFGYDIHKLVTGRKLLLGGVEIPSSVGEKAHSDGDVLIHAVIDALLGAASLGDIGKHFPPGDPAFKGISSRLLLAKTKTLIHNHGYTISNIDSTIILERPKLLPHITAMKEHIASDLGIVPGDISIKGKTKEQCDATGAGEAVEAYAVVLLLTQTAEQHA
jgi:2-C-methyl-D-erythritol 2,4-cyclodiphosphate synthase